MFSPKVFPPELYGSESNWQRDTLLVINGEDEQYYGFLKSDGSFQISSVKPGSYVVEVRNPDFVYEPVSPFHLLATIPLSHLNFKFQVRVEINPKGKFRARKVNFIQPSQVIQVPYPLKLKAFTRFRYFQQREQWKITDFLFNPMVLMMVLPLILLLVLPKIMSDPETKKEMEQLNLLKSNDFEISEMITSFFTGAPPPAKDKPKTQPEKKKKRN
jgi:hypothetical protein